MRYCCCVILLLFPVLLAAQTSRSINGILLEDDTSLPVVQGGVQLLDIKDSTVVESTVTGPDGKFTIEANPGDYIIKFSYLGFATQYKNIHQTVSKEGLSLGTIRLGIETMLLDAAVFTEKVEPVTVKEDTVVYNAAAFRVAEDASLDELLRKIPGLEVGSDNSVTLHGRPVTQLMVNGKRYFGGNVKDALKNIPANMVDNLRAYDRQSDQARISGVEDGEAAPVIDVSIKKSMTDRWNNRITFSGGSSERYAANAVANKLGGKKQATLTARRSNEGGTAGINATSANQIGKGGSGNNLSDQIGYTFSNESPKMDLDGHFLFTDNNREVESSSRSENVQTSGTTWGNSSAVRHAVAPVLKTNLTAEIKPGEFVTVYLKPNFSFSRNSSYNCSRGRTFRSDPLEVCSDIGSYMDFDSPDDPYGQIRVNATNNVQNSSTYALNADLTASITLRSTQKKGRSRTLRLRGVYNMNNSDAFNTYRTRYYRIKSNPDSILYRSNYVDSDQDMYQMQCGYSRSEPLGKSFHLQGNYTFDYIRYVNSKSYYDLGKADVDWVAGESLRLREQKAGLPVGYQNYRYDLFSASGTYERFVSAFTVGLARYRKKYNYTIGAVVRPQSCRLTYEGEAVWVNLCDIAPNLVFKYRFSKTNTLSFSYRSWTNSPSLGNLLPITNGTNPQYVTVGNPYLKPQFVSNGTLSYNTSNRKKQSGFVGNISYTRTDHAFTKSTEYDEQTGVRTSTTKNVDGSWFATASTAYNKTFSDKRFSLINHNAAEYRKTISLLYNNKLKADETNIMTRSMIKERLEGCLRNNFSEIILNVGIEYTSEISSLRPELSRHPVSYIAGISSEATLPCRLRLEADFTTLFQRGWSYSELNRNYYVWNMEISQPVFRKKATIRLGWYDILGNLENVSRSFSATSRSISYYNGVTNYIMLRFVYRFML